jgi:threonylcarbamoyladenosine tRNA methylthiotransferase MtaB
VRRRRAEVLRALGDAKRLAFHRRQVGRVLPVLFEKPARAGVAEGYTANYIRVLVAHPDAAALRNRIRPVLLAEAGSETMAGQMAGG